MEWIVLKLGAIAGGLAIGYALLVVRRKRDLSNLVDAADRPRLLRELQEMRDRGESFAARMQFLRAQGLRPNVAEGLIIDSEAKQVADIVSTKTVTRVGYSVSYPGNWKLSSIGPPEVVERFFSVESSASALVTVGIYDGRVDEMPDPEELLELVTNDFRSVSRTSIDTWGSFSGAGFQYTAENVGVPLFGKVFCWRQGDRGFHVASVCAEEDRADAEPGLKLVEESLVRNDEPRSAPPVA